jgi:O-antigen ligase
MITLLALGLALLLAGALSVALLDLLVRRADVGAGFALGAMLLQAVFVTQAPSLYLHSVRVGATDVLFVFLVAAGIARMLRLRRYSPFLRWLLLLGVVALVSLARGVLALGMAQSVSDFRQYMQFIGAALYFATFPPSARLYDRIGRLWLAAAVPMMLLVSVRWLKVFAGVDLGIPMEQFGNDTAIRVIDGPFTFFLAHAAMATVPVWQWQGERARRLRRLSVLLLLFVMLLDRRTVWIAMVAGVVVLATRDHRLGRRGLAMVGAAAIVTTAVFIAFPSGGSDQEPLARSATSTSTLSWRIQGWSELVAAWSENPADWFVGQPFGAGFEREVEGSDVQSHPHDFYVETMLRTGIVGLLALIALTAGLLRALLRSWSGMATHDRGLFGRGVFPALLVMQLVWFITWVPGPEQGIVTGLAIALVAAQRRERRAVARAEPTGDRRLPLAGARQANRRAETGPATGGGRP